MVSRPMLAVAQPWGRGRAVAVHLAVDGGYAGLRRRRAGNSGDSCAAGLVAAAGHHGGGDLPAGDAAVSGCRGHWQQVRLYRRGCGDPGGTALGALANCRHHRLVAVYCWRRQGSPGGENEPDRSIMTWSPGHVKNSPPDQVKLSPDGGCAEGRFVLN
jgi:hypothetical protein